MRNTTQVNLTWRVGPIALGLTVLSMFMNPTEARAFCRLGYGAPELTLVGFPSPKPDNYHVALLTARRHPADGGGHFNLVETVPWGTSSSSFCLLPGRWQFQAQDEEGLVGPDTSTGWTDYDVSCEEDDTSYSGVRCSGTATIEMHKPYTQGANNISHRPRCTQEPCAPCAAVGEPVSCLTGNMFLDQTDASIPGWGPGLNLTRSYNSGTAYGGYEGAFGAGWTHTYEKKLDVMEPGVVMVRNSNGVATFYRDSNGSQTFGAHLPATAKESVAESGGTYVRNFPDGAYETYDSSGNLTSMVDAVGNTLSLAYESGKLVSVTDPAGRQLTFTYAGGHITSVSGPAGVIAEYTYNGNNLETVTYPDQSGYAFSYDADRLTQVTDHEGVILETHTYEGNRATTSEIADGQELYTFNYDTPSITTVTDALGNVTTYAWEMKAGMRYVTEIAGPCESCPGGEYKEKWSYDDEGRLLNHTDALGHITTYTYDANGYLQTVADPLNRITSYTNNSQGRVLTRTDPEGGVTTWAYGPAGPETIEDPLGRTTTVTYRAEGKPETITDPRQKTTTLGYDNVGNLISVTDPLGNVTEYDYDPRGRPTSSEDPLDHTTTIEYDSRGRVEKIINPDDTFTEFDYDLGGRRTRVTDPGGGTTLYGYDDYGRLETVTAVTGPPNEVTTYGYDSMSNLESITDALGRVTIFEYDANGRLTKISHPKDSGEADRIETFTYDAEGRLETKTKRDGTKLTYSYDSAGQLIQTDAEDARGAHLETVVYDYDDAGRLILSQGGAFWDRLTWTYSLAGEVLTESFVGLSPTTVSYSYDDAGNRETLTLDGQSWLSYDYDDAGRLWHIHRGSKVFTFGYDAASRRTSLSYPNGVVTTYDYDTLSRLAGVTTKRGSTVIAESTYTHDDTGNRLSKLTESYSEIYTYDPIYRLDTVTRDFVLTEDYSYDAVGNRLSSLIHPTWTYNDRDELRSFDGTSFTYDLNGRTLTKADSTASWGYTWTWEDHLHRVDKDGARAASLRYDSLGRRVFKGTATASRIYTYDGMDILKETDLVTRATAMMYIHGPRRDEVLGAELANGNMFYAHSDGLGSIVKVTKANGTVVPAQNRQYDAFGNPQVGPGSGYAFTGREWDAKIGLYYYRARYYDPRIGRFISEDPIGLGGGVNLYAYVRNNPARYTDPLGLYNKDVHYYVTRQLAIEAGFNLWQAERIARGDQDMDDMSTFSPWTSRSNRTKYHFTNDERRCAMRSKAFQDKSWWEFGSYMHALQDSYSHQKGQTVREEPYGETFGHGWTPHPDRPEERPELYQKMLEHARQEMRDFYQLISDSGLKDVGR